jgi:DNA (cytosine-5)-methyltransferase 1
MNELIKVILPQQVKVRKYEVDIESLKLVLKEHKVKSGLTIKQISNKLELPKTLVEHWFRGDNSFSIPDEDIWLRLKELLNIENDEFDESVMTFHIRDGVYEKSNRVYDSNGIAPTLTVVSAENERYIIHDNCSKEDIMNKDKPILVGGIGEINFGKQFRQGNRIYDSENIAMCLMSQPVGNAGGYSYLYKLNNKQNKNNKGDNNLNNYTKNLTKYNFNMEEVKVFDVFAGIGSLHQSLTELGVPIKITNLSEVDVDAIISYAGIHIENFKDLEFNYPSKDEMKQWLMDRNIGYDFAKQKSSIPRMKVDKLENVYKASILLNNLGDISQINYEEIEDFDLMNCSFCCQDLSGAGKQKGLKNEDGTPTRSGLVVYGLKAIRVKKPKYIMIENVKGLIQKKFIDDFYDITKEIESIGYNCYYPKKENGQPTCLNAKNYGIPQNRERIFVICIRKDVDSGLFNFPQGFDNGLRLKDLLEDEVDEKYYLSQEIQDRFKMNGSEDVNRNELNVVGSSAPDFRTIGQRDVTYGTNGIMSTLTATDYKQPKQIMVREATKKGYSIAEEGDSINLEQPNSKTRRGRVGKVANTLNCGCNQGVIANDIIKLGDIPKEVLNDNERQRRVYSEEGISPTILARTDNTKILNTNKLNQLGELELEGYNDFSKRVYDIDGIGRTLMASGGNLNDKAGQYLDKSFKIRRLTPRECWRLMGFRDEHIERAIALGISDSQLYKQAGNSIVVDVLYYIFKELFKEYIKYNK